MPLGNHHLDHGLVCGLLGLAHRLAVRLAAAPRRCRPTRGWKTNCASRLPSAKRNGRRRAHSSPKPAPRWPPREANQAAAEKMLAEQQQLHEQNLREAKAAQEKALADLREAFKALSADALKQSAPEFLRLAEQTFGKFQETAKGDLAQRQEAIKTLVEPLKQQLETYQKRLQQSETVAVRHAGRGEETDWKCLSQQSQSLASETQQFRMVLKSNQARGRWGEETLRRVVEAAGMSAHCDFTRANPGRRQPSRT